MDTPAPEQIRSFQNVVWDFARDHHRAMPWRSDHSPYYVLVSELMLQQTGVARVFPKFEQFIEAFPTLSALAGAPLADVLTMWQGLGYNRRARFLHQAARMVQDEYAGVFPDTLEQLVKLPGVGKNTAGAIMAYAFDERVVFIETNIRTVLFHAFFEEAGTVDDRELAALMEVLLPDHGYREWYWALMDYGSHLKRTVGGRIAQSRHYSKQSPLKGSVREVRGRIVSLLTEGALDEPAIRARLAADERFEPALSGLIRDGLIARQQDILGLTAE